MGFLWVNKQQKKEEIQLIVEGKNIEIMSFALFFFIEIVFWPLVYWAFKTKRKLIKIKKKKEVSGKTTACSQTVLKSLI